MVAEVEGLILATHKRSLRIKYSTLEILPVPHARLVESLSSTEVHGIVGNQLTFQVRGIFTDRFTLVGLLTVAPVSYLITILRREQVAQIQGAPVYVITDVALIPLSSQSEAETAINQAKETLKKSGQEGTPSPDSETSDDDEFHHDHDVVESDIPTKDDLSIARPLNSARSNSSVAEDVIEKRGQYGRFAERWFSKKGWTTEKRRAQGMSTGGVDKLEASCDLVAGPTDLQSDSSSPATTLDGIESSDRTSVISITNQGPKSDVPGSPAANVTTTLIPKLLRTTRMLLASRSFFFSYELDITRRLGFNDKGYSTPLHKSVDPLVSH